MIDAGERLPVRLVKENGDTISLDATSVDIVVERMQSNFGIPLFDARKISTDFNQAVVMFEIQGVLADDDGQEETAQAVAKIDFDQPQTLATTNTPIGGGGFGGAPVAGPYTAGPAALGSVSVGGGGGSNSNGGVGFSFGSPPISSSDMGNYILDHWHGKHISLPVAYWTERDAKLDNPVTQNLQMWLKADALTSTLSHDSPVQTWSDSSGNGRSPTQSNSSQRPIYREHGANGQPYVFFPMTANQFLEYPWDSSNSPFLNPEQMTVFIVGSALSSNEPIISSRNSNSGYGISMFPSSGAVSFFHHNTQTDTGINLFSRNDTMMISAHFSDDAGDAGTVADNLNIFLNGRLEKESSSLTYTPLSQSDQGSFRIGYDGSAYAAAYIYEILVYNTPLVQGDRELVEGYLSRKYNIDLPESHPYSSGYSRSNKLIKFMFDQNRVTSRKEPFGFMNRASRTTGLRIASNGINGNTYTLESYSDTYGEQGVPNNASSWFEVTNSNSPVKIKFGEQLSNGAIKIRGGADNPVIGTVTSVNGALQIEVQLNQTTVPQPLDLILMAPDEGFDVGNNARPVIIIPIQNADTFEEFGLPDKATGPNFPNHELNSATRAGDDITRTDEYIAFLFKGAMTNTYMNFGRESVDDKDGNLMSDVFDVTTNTGEQGHQTYLIITQKYASSLGKLENVILTNIPEAKFGFSIEGFTGGKSGKKVKSGGDKAQDLIGILSNSNNFGTNRDTASAIETIHDFGAGAIQAVFYSGNSESRGDYIEGLQIPYSTFSTRGKSNFDTDIAQRNHFLTTADTVSDKYASANSIHASRPFSSVDEGHLRNGIKGMVSDLNIHRDAEMKAYEFSLKFVAADIIL